MKILSPLFLGALMVTPVFAQAAKLNCQDVIDAHKIPVCIDLGPVEQCDEEPSRIVKAGTRWQDEFQNAQALDAARDSEESCITDFSDVAENDGCCGG